EVATGPGPVYAYGQTEWADLEGAVQHALDAGAEDVILVGYSMGGASVTSFLDRSELASAVRGVILDSPLLSLAAAGDMQLRDGGVPGPLTGAMRWVAALRYDIDWEGMNYLDDVDAFSAPVLLIHGTVD